jgi:hypothetical protein
MPEFTVSVTDRDGAQAPRPRAQKCKCAPTTGPARFEVIVTERHAGERDVRFAQKCKCPPGFTGPWSQVAAGAPEVALSPLAD